MHRVLATRSLLLFSLCTLPLMAQDEDGWDQGYDAVRALMLQSKWQEARSSLEALLKQHEGKAYAIADRQSIVADHRQCVFWADAKMPKAEELLSGKIEKHDPATGQIRLRYVGDEMSDWKDARDNLLLHPMVFAGPFTLTISGKAHPDHAMGFFYDLGSQGYYRVLLGHGDDKPTLVHVQGDEEKELEKKGAVPGKPGQPYHAQLKVDKTTVEVTFDKKPLFKQKRNAADGIYMGLVQANYEEVVLEGQMEPSWFQNLADEHLNEQREQFETTYDKETMLPGWLFAETAAEKVPTRHDFAKERAKTPDAEEVMSWIEGGNFTDAAEKAEKLTESDFAAADLAYVRGVLLQATGDAEKALPFAEQALQAMPDATFTRLLMAQVLTDLRRPGEALPLLQKAHVDDPGHVDALEALFVALLRKSDVRGGERLVREAKIKHGMWAEVFDLDRMLSMRRRGPTWPRHFVATSAHYEVHSDIDKKICDDAIKVLEESYAALKGQFAELTEGPDTPKFPVYLFSGESGYQEYNSQILGQAVPHSAGLYSPVLKQLLIWNVPKREDMVRTIRHEGFHQFLDRVMIDPPVWLNEGMAEFWETAKKDGQKFTGGQPRPEHVATLLRSKKAIPKLKEFVYGPRSDFYRFAQQRYAQGWALVHFLRKTTPANLKIFQTLFDALRTGEGTSKQALDKAFAGVDWAKLDTEWWEYVDKMAKTK